MVFVCSWEHLACAGGGETWAAQAVIHSGVNSFYDQQAFQECGLWCLKPYLFMICLFKTGGAFFQSENWPPHEQDRGGRWYCLRGQEVSDLGKNNTESELLKN